MLRLHMAPVYNRSRGCFIDPVRVLCTRVPVEVRPELWVELVAGALEHLLRDRSPSLGEAIAHPVLGARRIKPRRDLAQGVATPEVTVGR